MQFSQINHQLQQLHMLLEKISDDIYTQPIIHLDNATMGGHSRHIIELVKIVTDGYEKGEVDYLNRKRNLLLETSRQYAINTLLQLQQQIAQPDKPFRLVAESLEVAIPHTIQSSYYREIVYATEHTIHHFALLKVALIELNIKMEQPDFGVAYATIQYRKNLENKSFSH